MAWAIEQPAGLILPANVAKPTNFASAPALGYPCLIFMHGNGQTSLADGLTRDSPTPITECNLDQMVKDSDGTDWPMIVWAAYDSSQTWSNARVADVIDDVVANAADYKIDVNQIYLTGLSLGAIGIHFTMELDPLHSKFRSTIKGVFPVSGSNVVFTVQEAQWAVDRAFTPLRGWYGQNDPNSWVVGGGNSMPSAASAINAVQSAYYELTEVAGAAHNSAAWGVPYQDHGNGVNTIYYEIEQNSAPDVDPPTLPSNLTFSNIKKHSATISWGASTDTGSGLSHYEVYVGGVSQGTTTNINFDIINLVPNTEYSVQVNAIDNEGNTSGASLNVTTLDDPASIGIGDELSVLI